MILTNLYRVPKVQSYVNHHNKFVFPPERVSEVLRNLLKPCSSNAYILVNQPGLTLDDLQHHESYTYLRTYSFMASTLAALPRIEKPVDFDELKRNIIGRCDAKVIELSDLNEVEAYIDVRTRLIMITMPELPEDPAERIEALKLAGKYSLILLYNDTNITDESIRRTVRKLPSPSHTLIYTALDKRLYDKYDEKKWEKLEIFHDIIKQDATRDYEYERNDKTNKKIDKTFPEKRTKLLKKVYLPKFIDKELILENELLVISVLLITLSLIVLQILKFVWIFCKWVLKKQPKHKKD